MQGKAKRDGCLVETTVLYFAASEPKFTRLSVCGQRQHRCPIYKKIVGFLKYQRSSSKVVINLAGKFDVFELSIFCGISCVRW